MLCAPFNYSKLFKSCLKRKPESRAPEDFKTSSNFDQFHQQVYCTALIGKCFILEKHVICDHLLLCAPRHLCPNTKYEPGHFSELGDYPVHSNHLISTSRLGVFIQLSCLMKDLCLHWNELLMEVYESVTVSRDCRRQERPSPRLCLFLIILTPQKAGVKVNKLLHVHAFSVPNYLFIIIIMHCAGLRRVCMSVCVFACTKALCIFNVGLSEPLVR